MYVENGETLQFRNSRVNGCKAIERKIEPWNVYQRCDILRQRIYLIVWQSKCSDDTVLNHKNIFEVIDQIIRGMDILQSFSNFPCYLACMLSTQIVSVRRMSRLMMYFFVSVKLIYLFFYLEIPSSLKRSNSAINLPWKCHRIRLRVCQYHQQLRQRQRLSSSLKTLWIRYHGAVHEKSKIWILLRKHWTIFFLPVPNCY